VLNQMLGLAPEAIPSLAEIATATTQLLGATACVLTNHDGMPLTVHGMDPEEADAKAALAPQLFRRIGGYLRRFRSDVATGALILPCRHGQLFLLDGDSVCMILDFERPISRATSNKALQVMTELDWLLGVRATVSAI